MKLNDSERSELEKFRERQKRREDYTNRYMKNNYKRLVCLYPIDKAYLIDEARGSQSISNYIMSLIQKDLKDRRLLSD